MTFLASGMAADTWFVESGGGDRRALPPGEDGKVEVAVSSGSALIYHEKERTAPRMTHEEWEKTTLVFEVRFDSTAVRELRGSIFVKDKDGWWFQDPNEFKLTPGEWQTLKLDITPETSPLMPQGHQGAWNTFFAVSRLTAGLSIYHSAGEYTLQCRAMRLEGKRADAPLNILEWQLPETAPVNNILQSTFQLSREYFNPFDSDEIMADYEVRYPDGTTRQFPAFYTMEYARQRHFTTEINTPDGRAYWAFRFTPEKPGIYEFRLLVKDHTGKTASTPWRKITAQVAPGKGFVRVAPNNHNLMFANGELFFPVGINIHTNVDLRSEIDFEFGHLPDQGTYDYDAYFEQMATNGINAVEIWMAAWSFAIEWNSARQNYHGLGRYNLCNASRLDHVLNTARARNIYVHLTLDNHTKLTNLEWGDNPFNTANPFKDANGSFLANTNDFFTNETARKLNRQRNRYIAARWGADPAIFGIEFWSEVDLVPNFQQLYDSQDLMKWHTEAVSEFRAMDQGHLLTTHYCGDYGRLLRWYQLLTLPVFDYIVGDAYRNPRRVHFIDLITAHAAAVKYFERPVIITEQGGASSGPGQAGFRLADIHSAPWLGLFLNLSAVPFTWWHDFVHIRNGYPHYKGFTDFIRNIDLKKQYEYMPLSVGQRHDWVGAPATFQERMFRNRIMVRGSDYCNMDFAYTYTGWPVGRNYIIQGMSMNNDNFMAGWIFNRPHMNSYPPPGQWLPYFHDYLIQLAPGLKPGRYLVTFCDTVTNQVLDRREAVISKPGEVVLVPVPSFQIDVAFKVVEVEK